MICRRAALATVLVLSLSGCAQTFDATTLGVPATLSSAAGHPPEGERFRVSSKAVFGAWGIVQLKEPSLRKALAGQLAGASGVADVKIKIHSGFFDFLVTVLTVGLIIPRSVTFEGIVTK